MLTSRPGTTTTRSTLRRSSQSWTRRPAPPAPPSPPPPPPRPPPVRQRLVADSLFPGAGLDGEATAHLAVHLNDDEDFFAGQRPGIGLGPRLPEAALRVAQAGPELLRQVGGEGSQQEDQRFDGFAEEGPALLAAHRVLGGRVEGVEGVDQLHDRADRRVEVELVLDVVGHALDRLVNRPPEAAALRGKLPDRGPRIDPFQLLQERRDEAPDAVEAARGPLHAAVVPVQVLFRRGREEG